MLNSKLRNPNSFASFMMRVNRSGERKGLQLASNSLRSSTKDLYDSAISSDSNIEQIKKNLSKVDSFLNLIGKITADGIKLSRMISRNFSESDYPSYGEQYENSYDISKSSLHRSIVNMFEALDDMITIQIKSKENEQNDQAKLLEPHIQKLSSILKRGLKYMIQNNDHFKQYIKSLFLYKQKTPNGNRVSILDVNLTDPDLLEAVMQAKHGSPDLYKRALKLFQDRKKFDLKHLFRRPKLLLEILGLNLDIENQLDFYRAS